MAGYKEFIAYATNKEIGAGKIHDTLVIKVPTGKCMEIDWIGVIPDLDPKGVSGLDYARITYNGSEIPELKFSVNWYRNMLPYSHVESKRPPRPFGTLKTPNSLTLKFRSDTIVTVRFYALPDVAVTTPYHVIAHGILYEKPEKVEEIFGAGVTPANFDTLIGGVKQPLPSLMPWIQFFTNPVATTPNVYETIEQIKVNYDEILTIRAMGVAPHKNHLETWFLIDTTYYPHIPFITTPEANPLPFGGHIDYQPPFVFDQPIVLKEQVLDIKIRDNGISIPPKSTFIALWGTWQRLAVAPPVAPPVVLAPEFRPPTPEQILLKR